MSSFDEYLIGLVGKWNGWGLVLFTVITTVIATVLTGLIGFERERAGQAAGLRTHVVIGIASAMVRTISIYAIRVALAKTSGFFLKSMEGGIDGKRLQAPYYDASRIAASILAGFGFMGAGTIVKNGLSIRGLTTAATIWFSASIGMGCGCGFVVETAVVTILAWTLLVTLTKVEKRLDNHSPHVERKVAPNIPILHEIRSQADKYSLIIKNIVTHKGIKDNGGDEVSVTVYFSYHTDKATIADFCESFSSYPYVYSIVRSTSKDEKIQND